MSEVQLKLRFSEKLRRKLELAARKNKRSMNLEIVVRLNTSFDDALDELRRAIVDLTR